jgi:hypothetical protein
MAATKDGGPITPVAWARSYSAKVNRWADGLFRPVDSASLVFLRVAFGVIMLVECWRFWDHGWIERYFIRPDFLFKYYGFEWVQPWPGDGMYWHFGLLAVLSLMITIGLFYRLAMTVFFFAFSYIFLLDQARYLNHFYLVMIVAFLMILVPASRTYSVDAWLNARFGRARERTVPMWSTWIFRCQFEVLYLYAGIVKVNADWLRLEPLGMWLARRDDAPLIGALFNEDWVVAVAAYGSAGLHLLGAPLLLFRRTRIYITVVYFAFHLSNHFMFQIGIFPWLTMAGTLMFFDPDWPRQVWRALWRKVGRFAAAAEKTADV